MARENRETHLLQLAADVKRTYLAERRLFYIKTRGDDSNYSPRSDVVEHWDGGRDARGVNHKSAWERLAKFALEWRVDPLELVRAAFEMAEHNDPPTPSMIQSQWGLNALKYVKTFNVEETKTRFACYADEAKMNFHLWRQTNSSDEETWREIVSSPELSFSPLFRFMLAHSLNLKKLSDRWTQPATQEYIRAPALYDKALGDAIPVDFREEAMRIRQLISRGN